MREYAVKLGKMGISYNRYRELVHFCRQYEHLDSIQRELIERAAKHAAEEYWEILLKSICQGELPYRYLDFPYSESQYKRIRREFFKNLHEIRK